MEQINSRRITKIVKISVLSLIGLVFLFGSFGTISAGEIGVKTRFGAVVGTVTEGLYFKLPLIEKINIIDIRTRTVNYDKNGSEGDAKDTSQLFGASKDLQDVYMSVVVNYAIDSGKATEIFSKYSSTENYQFNVIEPIIRETVKTMSAQYTAEELVTKRAEFSDKVNIGLSKEFQDKFSTLQRFSVTNFEFSKTFSQAIEAKVTATQNAEAAKNKLEQVKFEAQQQIEKAKAEAETIKIKAQAITQQGGKDYVQLQAIDKWNGVLPAQMIPNATVPFIDLK